MPQLVTLEMAKNHLRVDTDDDDALIESYIDAAEAHAEQYMNRPLTPWNPEDETVQVPESITIAILLLVGNFYENRESVSQNYNYYVNPTFTNLLNFYRLDMGI